MIKSLVFPICPSANKNHNSLLLQIVFKIVIENSSSTNTKTKTSFWFDLGKQDYSQEEDIIEIIVSNSMCQDSWDWKGIKFSERRKQGIKQPKYCSTMMP